MKRRYPASARLRAEARELEEELAAHRARAKAHSRPEVIKARREARAFYATARALARRAYSAEDEEVARVAKAFSHPARVKILRLLDQPGALICDQIVREMPIAQATVSQHLKVLKTAGFITGRRDSLRVYYSLMPQALQRARELLRLM